jgi:hypothetical protein
VHRDVFERVEGPDPARWFCLEHRAVADSKQLPHLVDRQRILLVRVHDLKHPRHVVRIVGQLAQALAQLCELRNRAASGSFVSHRSRTRPDRRP